MKDPATREATSFLCRPVVEKLRILENRARQLVRWPEFNLYSPQDVSEVLFQRLQLPVPPGTKRSPRHISTDKSVSHRAVTCQLLLFVLDLVKRQLKAGRQTSGAEVICVEGNKAGSPSLLCNIEMTLKEAETGQAPAAVDQGFTDLLRIQRLP